MDRSNERPPSSLPVMGGNPTINGATPLSEAREVENQRENRRPESYPDASKGRNPSQGGF
jgi:hypothetical protein